MASREEIFSAVIKLNDHEATSKLQKMETQLAALKKRRDEALQHGKIDVWKAANKEIDKLEIKVRKQNQLIGTMNHTLDSLSTAKQKELEQILRDINRHLNSGAVERNSKEWKELNECLKQTKHELQIIKSESEQQMSFWGKFTGFLNKNWGAITQIFGAVTGISATIRSTVSDYAAMEQEMANVRKYTGQTAEEVEELNEHLKAMDTRTSREELNQLAGAAGRLGITATDQILEFVEAADMIGVALGDDLGEGAVDTIGKLAIAFGENDRLGLRGAMLATGSALNEIVQKSSAQAKPVVEFTAMLSGVGQQAHMTQAEIMGYASVLDQNNQEMATASTVMSQLITKMYQDPARFAKMAGLEVEKFTETIKNNMNEGLLQWFQAVNKLGDMSVLARKFDELKMDGTRAVGVLATLAGHVDQLAEAQKTANDAYEKGTSVIEEFGIQNKTVEAGLDKAKKAFKEVAIELGRNLMPIVKYTISGTGLLVKGLNAIVKFALNNKALILTIAGYILILNAAKLKKIALDKLEVFWNDKVKDALQGLWKVMRQHPYLTLAAAATFLVSKYAALVTKTDELRRKQKALAEVQKEAAASTGDELNKINALRKIVDDANQSIDNRRTAIKELQKIVPDYHASLTEEGRLINNNADALNNYCKKLQLTAQIQAASTKLTKAQTELREYEEDISGSEGITKAMWNENVEGMTENEAIAAAQVNPSAYRTVKAKLKRLEGEVSLYQGMIDQFTQQMTDLASNTSDVGDKGTGGGGGGTVGGSSDDPLRKIEKDLKEALQRQQVEALLSYRQGEISYQQYLDRMDELQKQSFADRRKVYEKAHATERQEYWQLLKEQSDYQDQQAEEGRKKRDSELRRDKVLREANIRQQYNDIASEIYQDEEALNEALFRNEREFLQKRIENARQGTQERMQLEQQLADLDEHHRLELAESYEKKLKQMRSSYARMSAQEQMEAELAGLKLLYESKMNQGRISEEQYQQMIQQIREKYAKNIKDEQDERIHKGDKQQSKGASIADGVFNVLTIADNYKLEMEAIDQMLADHTINEQEAADKRRQIWGESMEAIAAAASVAFNGINQIVSAASSYAQACSDLEVARITANYDRQIEAAGKNSHQREKLEKQRDEAIAKAKTKANKKAMAMELAQAIAQTAMGAISAYSSTMAGAPYPANLVLAPISAGIALAAGALQIATIKKQHEAEAAGYYEGGFTGGRRYRKEAGVVHEGEFVANHQAVNNPAVMPFLHFLDQAQRNNTVGSLTAADVSRIVGTGFPASTPSVVAPIVNVQTDNEQLRMAVDAHREATELLLLRLQQPINAQVVLTGPDGLNAQQQRLNNLMKNK